MRFKRNANEYRLFRDDGIHTNVVVVDSREDEGCFFIFDGPTCVGVADSLREAKAIARSSASKSGDSSTLGK